MILMPTIGSIEDLISKWVATPNKFNHLRLFIHRDRKGDTKPNYQFLMVTPLTFGLVIVKDLTIEEPFVIIKFFDCAMGLIGNVRVNIHDEKPNVLFVCWDDIVDMVKEYKPEDYEK